MQFFKGRTKRDYLTNPWNLIDLAVIILTVIVLLHTFVGIRLLKTDQLRPLAAITSILMFVSIYDWLRLF